MGRFTGWILDLYTESPGKMVVWLKLEDGETRRLVDRWAPSIFVASDSRRDLADLEKGRGRDFSWSRRVMKLERATDKGESEVLELVVDDAKKLAPLAESVERSRPFGAYRLYNVDVPPEQMYLYENDLFPLAYCEVAETRDGLSWDIQDDIWSCQYDVPPLRSVSLDVRIRKAGRMAKVSDPIESIGLKGGDGSVTTIDGGSEESKILGLVEDVRRLDPDLVFTNDGDAFVLPYLVGRAGANGIADRLKIDRDGNVLEAPAKKGTSYFSYGKILFKPSGMRFSGRIHLDTTSSFVNKECGLEGFFEVSRVCRLPLHTASRASIGKALSSLQFYYATKDGILIPWKPVMAEHFKSRAELLVADRGGFIFEPELGVHEGVGELDFSCLVKDSIVETRSGKKRIADIEDCDEVFTPFGWQKILKIHRYRIRARVVKLTLEDGKTLTCTPNHKFPVLVRGAFEEKTADKIHRGSKLVVADTLQGLQKDDAACIFGVFTAEGSRLRKDALYFDKSRNKKRIFHQYRIEFSIGEVENDLRTFIVNSLSRLYPKIRVYEKIKKGEKGLSISVSQKAVVNDFLSRYDSFIGNDRLAPEEKASFLRGFFEGDGGPNKRRKTVQCSQSSVNAAKLEIVCKYLRDLGIKYHGGSYRYDDGVSTNPKLVLELSGLEAQVRFYTQVGFISQNKEGKLRQMILTRIREAKHHNTRFGLYIKAQKNNALSFVREARVVNKENQGYNGSVYDITLEWNEFPYYFANGVLTHNSLFPSIMSKKNISPETVRCACCPDSKNRIPELDWNVCERRPEGIVPKAVKIIVEKRMKYKRLEQITQGEERARYESRRSALKWVGVACLPKESPVFIRSGGADRSVRIGDFIDGLVGDRVGVMECPPGVFVAGVGHDYKAKWCKVARLIKKPNDQKLLSLVMEDGRKIITTPDHRFFTLRGGDLEIRTAEDMQVGELVPVARKIPPANEIHYVDLIEQLTGLLSSQEQQLWRVSGEQLKEVIKAERKTLIGMATSEGYSYQSVISWIKSGIIPLRFLKMLDVAPEIHSALRIGSGRRKGGRVAWLPAVLEVDGGLGFFLGLFVADGSAKNNAVRLDIALSEPALLETTRKLVESIFKISPRVYKEKRAQMHVVQINSASLVRVLEKVFGLPGSAEKGKLKVPDIIFNCPPQAAHRFMAGLVAGDGNAGKRRKFVSIATASKNLQNQISVLAARLGLAFRMQADRREGAQPLYTVSFVGPETLGIIGNWEYSKEGKRDKIRSWSEESQTGTCTHIRYERLPIDESGLFTLAKSTRTSSEPHARAGSRLCPIQVKKKITRIRSRKLNENQVTQTMKIERLMDSDLGFVRIKRVERLNACPEFVYCFQMEDYEVPGFFAGEGLTYTRNCFGYLGFNNAKFGRIDAHIGVCAWDRKVLVDAARVAERRGFRVMHGIVDSLWLKKAGAGRGDFEKLRREIEAETKFAISFEGIYKWIAFLPSKVNAGVPVLNQYFGAYQDGKLKVRGIEARRHDTPAFFSKCQLEILELLATAGDVEEAKAMVGECIGIFLKHARSLLDHRAPIEGLVFTRNLSKKPGEYANRSLTSIVADQMVREGVELHAGEAVQYVITDYESKSPGKRAVAFELADERTVYDAKRYVKLLAETSSTVLRPFREDCGAEALLSTVDREILHRDLSGHLEALA